MGKEFWKAAGKRALKTVCQTAIAGIGCAMTIEEVNWAYILSTSVLAGLLSLLMSISMGLPEVNEK